MANLVGTQPDPATTDKLLTQLRNVVGTWRPFGVNLSTDERLALLHPRLGAETYIARITDVAGKYNVAIEAIPLQGMTNDVALYTMLRPFQDRFEAALTLVDDTARQAESEMWEAFLAYYGVLGGLAPHQPALAADLAPIVAFMATGPRQEKPVEPAAPAAPAAPAEPPKPAARKGRRASGRTALQNRVGDQVPDEKVRVQLLADLDEIVAAWKPHGVVLNTAQRRRLHHARTGAEPHIARIQEIALKYGIVVEGFPLQGMVDDLALFTTLRPFQDELRAGLQLLDDTAGEAESEAWEAFLAYYGALTGMAKHVPAAAADMAPIVDFMKSGPHKPPTAPTQKG